MAKALTFLFGLSRRPRPVSWLALTALAAALVMIATGAATATPAGTCAPTGQETIQTDMPDYAPEETVHMSGTGYAPSCDVVVQVTRPNGSVVKGDGSFEPGSDTVTTDADGNLTYDYILDGIEGEYLVEVLGAGGAVLATHTFTDAVSAVLEGGGDWSATGSTCSAPNNAISDAGAANSVRASCDFGETVVGRDFDLQSQVPSSAKDISFVVIVRGGVDNSDDNDIFDVSLSPDGGGAYTSVNATDVVNNALGGTSDDNVEAPAAGTSTACAAQSNFGRTWSYSEISDANFRVKVAAHPKTIAGADALLQSMDIDDIDLVVCWAGRFVTTASVSGPQANNPGTRDVSLTVNHTLATGFSAATADDWGSTEYQIEGGTPTCVNVPNPDITNSATDTRSVAVEPPLAAGSYDVTVRAFSDSACSQGASAPFVITDGITVDPGFPTLHRSSEPQTSATFEHAVASGSNRLLLVAVMIDSIEDATAVTYGGTALTHVVTNAAAAGTSDGQRVEIWRLKNPPVGTDDVVVTFAGDGVVYKGIAAANYTGVDQGTPIGASGGATSGSRTLTTTRAGSRIFAAVSAGGEPSAPFTTTSPVTELWDGVTGGGSGQESTDAGLWGGELAAPTIGNYTIGTLHTGPVGTDLSIAAVEILAAPNTAPLCAADSASTDEDTALNDTLACSDVDGNDLDYTVTQNPAHGTLTSFDAETGDFTYEPAANYHGPDSFKFKANDGSADSNEATFSITVDAVNDAPTCADDSASTDEDTALNDSLACSDVDGVDDLDYTVTQDPAHGTLTSFDAETGDFTYEPAGNYNGPDSFKFKANDGTADSNEATFDITVNAVNDAPTANDDAYGTDENTPLTVSEPGVLDNDSDVENDPFTAVLDDDVDHGTLTLHADGSFDYTPNPFFAGTDTFTYHATDGSDDSNVATVTITVGEADADNDGLNDNVDCTDHLADKHVVGLSPVPPTYTGGVHPTLQAAVNAAADNDVISMYVNTTENVVIGGGKDLRIEGCGHRVTAPNPALPAIRVLSSAGRVDGDTGAGERDIHIANLNVRQATGTAGYLVETTKTSSTGTSTLLDAVRSESNSIGIKVTGHGNHLRGSNGVKGSSGDGIQVIGNSNLIEENEVEDNHSDGIDVTGNSNTLKKNDVERSTSDGIKVAGNSNQIPENDVVDNGGYGVKVTNNGNALTKNDVKGSGVDGINVVGSGNTMPENNVDGSDGDGFDVSGGTSGAPNLLTKNHSGASDGNAGNGYLIGGAGNGKPDPVELVENEATNNHLNGFRVTGTGHELGKNKASSNVLCEFSVVSGNFNSKDNKFNSSTVTPNTDGAAFPTTCLG